ncbi:hypothetical protein P3X46_031626 [Hevea brasiliensis]|uniref:Uncharacterized protein n=1 Tax=Hevea brasiliensis TaxID=3981 RepID=A0ABQ9KNV2_HEVBR|nr:uncharacterized protein LOC110642644 [Hevea brasiliensis]XP_021650445.1 uncharacterized protein LOC110642644 [Hevea brasiliensis]KAJ9141043.1 hypothetical protein P3X46_031626 [Hevea brasiliensis]KAJ9141044.1 hypothetical protein P3X46_031626 [Hevea brasiliensis]
MEVGSVSSVERTLWACSVMEAMVVETALAAWKSLAYLFFVVGSLPDDIDALPKLTAMDERFPLNELFKIKHPDAENKDASDTEDDDEEDDDNAEDPDDEGDGDFSGEEGGEEGDPEDDPEANGEGGSDDEDDDDDDDDGDEDDDEEDEEDEEEEEEEEEVPQPPAKKRK